MTKLPVLYNYVIWRGERIVREYKSLRERCPFEAFIKTCIFCWLGS